MLPSTPEVISFVRSYWSLFLSSRFVSLSLSIAIGFLWAFVVYNGWADYSIVSLYTYPVWLSIFFASLYFSFCVSPSERKVYKEINNAFNSLKMQEVEGLVDKVDRFFYLLPTARIKLGLSQVLAHREKGDLLEAYNKIQTIRQLSLLPQEQVKVDINFAFILLHSGNNKAAKSELNRLSSKRLNKENRERLLRLETEIKLISNDLQAAKDLLENRLYEPDLDYKRKLYLLHELAVYETYLGNYESAATNYRQSCSLQEQYSIGFAQLERTVENLIFIYAKQGKYTEINSCLSKLKKLVDPTSVDQLIALNNIKINIARQLKDRDGLVVAYEESKRVIRPKLQGELEFYYQISQLRMCWNDEMDFEQVLTRTMSSLLKRPPISALHYLRVLKEVIGTVRQALDRTELRRDLRDYYSWLIMEWQKLQPEIDQYLDSIPAVLPGLRDEVFRFKLEGIKSNFSSYPLLPKSLIDEMFSLLNQQKSLWHGMENKEGQLEALTLVLDEYTAIAEQINDPLFIKDYREIAVSALLEAEKLLVEERPCLMYATYYVGMAFYCYKLDIKKAQAEEWLNIFDATKHSLDHYADWLRSQYKHAKSWVKE